MFQHSQGVQGCTKTRGMRRAGAAAGPLLPPGWGQGHVTSRTAWSRGVSWNLLDLTLQTSSSPGPFDSPSSHQRSFHGLSRRCFRGSAGLSLVCYFFLKKCISDPKTCSIRRSLFFPPARLYMLVCLSQEATNITRHPKCLGQCE